MVDMSHYGKMDTGIGNFPENFQYFFSILIRQEPVWLERERFGSDSDGFQIGKA